MNKKNSSGSGVFLMEMIMVVFFFIICASVCILVFVKANHMSRLAKDTNQSVIAAESIAEVWKQEGEAGLIEWMNAVGLEAAREDTNGVAIYWDTGWKLAKQPDQAAYQAEVIWEDTDGLAQATIVLVRNDDLKELFSMEVNRYQKTP
ncbi:MAG: hypothetical protein ACRDBO_17535 [Lachnospiraceae bacterium]